MRAGLAIGFLVFLLAGAAPAGAVDPAFSAPAPGAAGAGQIDSQEINRMMQQITQDPESMRLIQELQNDPQMKRILEDPELLKAVQEGNTQRLARDPKVQALQSNDKLQQLYQRNR